MPSPLLEIRNATKIYTSGGFMGRGAKSVVALENFNLTIDAKPASIVTIAGESGSGKTTLANLMLGFIRLTSGQIIYNGEDVTNMDNKQLLEYRRNVQAVFQDPFGVYNPFYRVEHVFHLVNKHFKLSSNKSEYRDMVEEGLNVVGLQGKDVLPKYPHQLSGGQRQRIMMARAYMIKPRLIVADEPVSMVDASLRASILDAMLRLRDESNISFLYITHDLSTAYQIGDQIYMLYQGTTAERGNAVDVIDAPQHPYVQLLIDSVPVPDPTQKWDVNISLPSEEEMRSATSKGCRYYPRCPHRMDKCLVEHPPLYKISEKGHEAACYLYDENEVAKLRELTQEEIERSQQPKPRQTDRKPMIAAVIALIIIAGALFLLSNQGDDTPAEGIVTEDTPIAEAASEEATSDTAEEVVVPSATPEDTVDVLRNPATLLSMDDATDMGALEIGIASPAEITDETEKHSFTFEGTAGQTILLRVGARGSAFTAPYGFVYDPDGEFVVVSGDTERRSRSMRVEQVLPKDGTYTIIVGAIDGNGIEEYEITVELVESEAVEPTAEPTATTPVESANEVDDALINPETLLSMDDATDMGALELGIVSAPGEFTADGEKHSYTFEGTAGQTILLRVNARGSAFTSPYGFLYSPDGAFIIASGDTSKRARSMRVEHTLEADGTYTIIVGPIGGNGIEEYEVTVSESED